ncbi:hypothetical protein DRQ36_06110, partial [bacterium]
MKYVIVAAFVFVFFANALAIPQTMQYQGKLTNIDGVGYNDTLEMTFRIFDVETGGTELWSETYSGTDEVPVVKGLFDVLLGSITPIDIEFDTFYWLEIEVDGNILDPRVELSSSPYSFRAAIADSIVGGVPDNVLDGTALNQTLRWDGTEWIPSDALTNDDADITTTGDIDVGGTRITISGATGSRLDFSGGGGIITSPTGIEARIDDDDDGTVSEFKILRNGSSEELFIAAEERYIQIIPRDTEPAATPPGGLYVNNSASPHKLYFYDNTGWQELGTGTGADNDWQINGDGLAPDTVYNTSDFIGIGTDAPQAKLSINDPGYTSSALYVDAGGATYSARFDSGGVIVQDGGLQEAHLATGFNGVYGRMGLATATDKYAVRGVADGGNGTKYAANFTATNSGNNYGVWSRATNGNIAYGGAFEAHLAGDQNIGIFASDQNPANYPPGSGISYAGWFDGDVAIDGGIYDAGASATGFGTPGQVLTTDGAGDIYWGAAGGTDNDWTGAGTGKMYATNITDDVGIGTTTPNTDLEIRFDNTSGDLRNGLTIFNHNGGGTAMNYAGINFSTWDSQYPKSWFGVQRNGMNGISSFVWCNYNNTASAPVDASHEIMRLNYKGQLGIGNSPDEAYFDLRGGTSNDCQMTLRPGSDPGPTHKHDGNLWYNGTNLYFYNGVTDIDLLAAGSSQWEDAGTCKRVIGNDNVRAYEIGEPYGLYGKTTDTDTYNYG